MRYFRIQDKCTYKDASPAGRSWALATKTFDLAIRLHLVVLQDGHLDLLALVLDLLRGLYTSRSLVHQRVIRKMLEHTL